MFNVVYTLSRAHREVTVVDVSYDSTGYPLFLFYDNASHSWMRKSAKYFIPA